jgi:hypothetical protein
MARQFFQEVVRWYYQLEEEFKRLRSIPPKFRAPEYLRCCHVFPARAALW